MVPHPPSPSQALRPTVPRPLAVLETVRFGEYLRDQLLLSEEQWLAALAAHWSAEPRRRIGETVVDLGFLSHDSIERAATEFHDGLDIVEVAGARPTA
jgi:hypothetical protein